MTGMWDRRNCLSVSYLVFVLKMILLYFTPVTWAQDQPNDYFICDYATQANEAALKSNEASVWTVIASKMEEMKRIEDRSVQKLESLMKDVLEASKKSEDAFEQAEERFKLVNGQYLNDRQLNQLIQRHTELTSQARNAARSSVDSAESIREEILARAQIARHAKNAAIEAALSFGALAQSAQGLAQTRTRERVSDGDRLKDVELDALWILVDTVVGNVAGGKMWTAPNATCERGSLCAAYLSAVEGPSINVQQSRDFQPADARAMAAFLRIALLGGDHWDQLLEHVLSLEMEEVGDQNKLQRYNRWAKEFGNRLGNAQADAVVVSDFIRGVVSKIGQDSEVSKIWPAVVAILADFVSENSQFQMAGEQLIKKAKQEFVGQEGNRGELDEMIARLKSELMTGWQEASTARDRLLDSLRGKRAEWISTAIRINDVASNGEAGLLGLTFRTLVSSRLPCADDVICRGISSASNDIVDEAPFVAASLHASAQQAIAQSIAFGFWIKEIREDAVGRKFSALARYFDILAYMLERRIELVNESPNALEIAWHQNGGRFELANAIRKNMHRIKSEYFAAVTLFKRAEKKFEEANEAAVQPPVPPSLLSRSWREIIPNLSRLKLFESELRRIGGTGCHIASKILEHKKCDIEGDILCGHAFQ